MLEMDKKRVLRLVKSVLQVAIAVIGIGWVVSKMSWKDHALAILPGQSMPTKNVVLATEHATDADLAYEIVDPRTGATITLPARSSCQ